VLFLHLIQLLHLLIKLLHTHAISHLEIRDLLKPVECLIYVPSGLLNLPVNAHDPVSECIHQERVVLLLLQAAIRVEDDRSVQVLLVHALSLLGIFIIGGGRG